MFDFQFKIQNSKEAQEAEAEGRLIAEAQLSHLARAAHDSFGP